MFYEIQYFINSVAERIALTFEGFWSAVGSIHYSFGEFFYDIRNIWSTW